MNEQRECKCEKFEDGMKAVNGPITLQSARSGGAYQFDQKYVFRFCPWCGSQLHRADDEPWNEFVRLTEEIDRRLRK